MDDDTVKRVAVLVIAATSQPVYRHHLAAYWTDFIRHSQDSLPNVDVYLLVEHGEARRPYAHVNDHVIEDPIGDFDRVLPRRFQYTGVPSILSKTIHALELLGGTYDVFFRTNLSSIILGTRFNEFVQSRTQIGYSGSWVWVDSLRRHITAHDLVGPDRAIQSLSELERYPGNTFISGSGYFLNATEAEQLVARRDELPYGLPDDVAIGLMLDRHEVLREFSERIASTTPIAEMLDRIERSTATHIRLEHLPVERARALWRYLSASEAWR